MVIEPAGTSSSTLILTLDEESSHIKSHSIVMAPDTI